MLSYAHSTAPAPVDDFAREVRDVKQWWASGSRFRHTKRPYTAEEAVGMRGTIPETFASNLMAQKLWAELEACRERKGFTHTFGALDPVQVTNEEILGCLSVVHCCWCVWLPH